MGLSVHRISWKGVLYLTSNGGAGRDILIVMTRRQMIGIACAAPFARSLDAAPAVKLGIDLYSLRSQNWTPAQLLAQVQET
jgi:hypothetical protein